ncbi:hypothetical protein V6N11_010548 [Hibiscus sabdariffa]|uniref:Uncharacterized protein n=1 Tax=Hibiscus sabdariffa TaxID=183260 RepID=A0ABR2S6G0_9ROSI
MGETSSKNMQKREDDALIASVGKEDVEGCVSNALEKSTCEVRVVQIKEGNKGDSGDVDLAECSEFVDEKNRFFPELSLKHRKVKRREKEEIVKLENQRYVAPRHKSTLLDDSHHQKPHPKADHGLPTTKG